MKRYIGMTPRWGVEIDEAAEPPAVHVWEFAAPHSRGVILLIGAAARDWNAMPLDQFVERHLKRITFRTWDGTEHDIGL